jgi:hypothetical protein
VAVVTLTRLNPPRHGWKLSDRRLSDLEDALIRPIRSLVGNDPNVIFTLWCIVVGVLLIAMTIGGSFVARLPLSAAMLYLAVGYAIGPAGLGLMDLAPLNDAMLLERLTEIALLISLFTVGMKLELPLDDKRWRIPVQLASVSMLVTVGAITALGVFVMGLPLGAAVLLGAILAPTDPVLASDVQVADPGDRDQLRFGLTGEGGLNDGTAFPFVMLGLGLLSLHDLGAGGWRWWTIDVVWAVAGGLAIGYVLGTLVGRAIIYLRTRHREALGADEFIAFGLIAFAYGVALLCATYGFLAVFAAGLALDRRPVVAAGLGGGGGTVIGQSRSTASRQCSSEHDESGAAFQRPIGAVRRSRGRAGGGRAARRRRVPQRGAVVHSGAVPGDSAARGVLGIARYRRQRNAAHADGLVRHPRYRLDLLSDVCDHSPDRPAARAEDRFDHDRDGGRVGRGARCFRDAADEPLRKAQITAEEAAVAPL